jgi:hypothetical protein
MAPPVVPPVIIPPVAGLSSDSSAHATSAKIASELAKTFIVKSIDLFIIIPLRPLTAWPRK